mmetsp:Transcript_27792/g.23344  ORF Transcript_27792/g.23344 Transcript_27792/m.23344 type:complete len:95 (+) Transcript_27792:1460-1744(+)
MSGNDGHLQMGSDENLQPLLTGPDGAAIYTFEEGHVLPNCLQNPSMNAIICHRDLANQINYGQIVFDDRTRMKMDRTFSPLTFTQIFDPLNQND